MSGDKVRFDTKMMQTGPNTTGVVVPPEVVAKLGGGGRPAVVVKLNDYSYRTTIGVMKGHAMLPFSAQHREASGISGGDAISVELSLDVQPRTVTVPDDLAQALEADPQLAAAFEKLAPSRRKADVENVVGAKTAETRARRIEAILSRLRG